VIPIVDTHQHLWDLNVLRPPWLDDVPALASDYVMDTYAEACRGFEVARTVYIEVDAAVDQIETERDYVFGLCDADDNPMAGATLRGRPGTEGFADWVNSLAEDSRAKGFRQIIHTPDLAPDYCLQDAFIADVRLLGDLEKHFDICIRPADLGSAVKLAQRCPDTRFVLDHCGNAHPEIVNGHLSPDAYDRSDGYWHDPDQWKRDMEALGRQENVVCKISGVIARLPEGKDATECLADTVNHCLDSFGPDGAVFGSDWPVCTLGAPYQTWVDTLNEIILDRPEEEQRKLLHDNAVAFYGL
jgi:predicted TIM-barrel fold metal-dependent hydrolase